MQAAKSQNLASGRTDAFLAMGAAALALWTVVLTYTALSQGQSHPGAVAMIAMSMAVAILSLVVSVQKRLTLFCISFLFVFLFFGVAPLVQISINADPIFLDDSTLFRACGCILVFHLTLVVGLILTPAATISELSSEMRTTARARDLILITLIVISGGYCFLSFGDMLFSSRNAFSIYIAGRYDAATATILSVAVMSLPFYGAVIGLRSSLIRRNAVLIVIYCALILLSLVINNPIITPRYKLAGLIIFSIIVMGGDRRPAPLLGALAVGVLLAPLLHVFRVESRLRGEVGRNLSMGQNPFAAMDYDAFQMLCYAVKRVEEVGISWGDNVLAAVLFFVPRALWGGKPLPTSVDVAQTVAKFRFVGTTNLSLPITGEGYYAGGFIGALLLSAVYVAMIVRLESMQRHSLTDSVIRGTISGLIFIILRGSLMIGVAYTVGAMLAASLALMCLRSRQHSESLRGS